MTSARVDDQTYVDDSAIYLMESSYKLLGLKIRYALEISFSVILGFWVSG